MESGGLVWRHRTSKSESAPLVCGMLACDGHVYCLQATEIEPAVPSVPADVPPTSDKLTVVFHRAGDVMVHVEDPQFPERMDKMMTDWMPMRRLVLDGRVIGTNVSLSE
eukprot:3773894-Prymnesium_polylepis.1